MADRQQQADNDGDCYGLSANLLGREAYPVEPSKVTLVRARTSSASLGSALDARILLFSPARYAGGRDGPQPSPFGWRFGRAKPIRHSDCQTPGTDPYLSIFTTQNN
jgi:hypothetical protein